MAVVRRKLKGVQRAPKKAARVRRAVSAPKGWRAQLGEPDAPQWREQWARACVQKCRDLGMSDPDVARRYVQAQWPGASYAGALAFIRGC